MAGIDLLPGGPSPLPAGKPSRNDAGGDTARSTSDPGNSAFGSVLSDSMRPSSRKDNTPSGRDQDDSSSAPSRAPNPPSSASPPSSQGKKSASKSDPRRSNDKGSTAKADSDPAEETAESTTATTDNSAQVNSDSTIENEVAEVQNDQQASADVASANADAPLQPGVAPAQLVAGLLIASTQTPTPNSPAAAIAAAPQNGSAQAQAAIANVQKAPPGLAIALEQAANSGVRETSAQGDSNSQPVSADVHSTQVSAGNSVSVRSANVPAAAQAAVNVTSDVQAPQIVVPKPEVKKSKDTKSQVPDVAADDGQPVVPVSQAGSDASTTSTDDAAPANVSTKPVPAPAVDAAAVTAAATDAPSTGDVKPASDLAPRPKAEKDQQGNGTSIGLASDTVPQDSGIQPDLTAPTKLSDISAGDANGGAQAAVAPPGSEQVAPYAKEREADPSADPTAPVTAFAPDNGTRRSDGLQTTGAAGSERSVNPSQVVDQVSHGIQLTHQSGERMQIHLRPPELGNLQIDVSMRDGMLSARLEAQTPATHQLLLDNLPQLKDSLSQQGLQVDRLEVDLSDSMRSDTSAGGNSGRSFEQQQNENLDGIWDPAPTNATTQRRTQTAASQATTARVASGPMLSLDITV